jgi:hypothetical protein
MKCRGLKDCCLQYFLCFYLLRTKFKGVVLFGKLDKVVRLLCEVFDEDSNDAYSAQEGVYIAEGFSRTPVLNFCDLRQVRLLTFRGTSMAKDDHLWDA